MASRTVPAEEVRLLRDDAEAVPVGGHVEGPQIGPVGGDPAGRGVVVPGDELDEGRLARPRLPDERHRLARRDAQVDTGQRLLVGAVREGDVLERDLAAQREHVERLIRVGGRGGLAQQLLDAAEGDGRLLVTVEDLGELLDGGEEQLDVEEVGDQGADGQRAVVDPARSDDDHGGGRDRGQQLDEREVDGDQPLTAHPGLAVVVAVLGVAGGPVVLAAEGLDDAEAGDGLLEVGVDGADACPGQFVRLDAAAPEEDRADDQHGQGGEDDQGELDVQDEQRDHDAEEGDHGDEGGDQPGLEERGERVHVRGHPGHDPAGQLPLVVVEAEPLELGEDLQAERVEDPLAGPAGHPDLAGLRHPLDEHDDQRDRGRRPHRAGGELGDALVDAVPDQDRQQQPHAGCRRRRARG